MIMNLEQLSKIALEQAKDIAGLKEKTASAHRRLDNIDKLTAGIHELARNVATLTAEVKTLAETFATVKDGQRSQGERIGAIEQIVHQIQQNENDISDLVAKVDELRMEPGNKWKTISACVISAVVGGGLMALFGFLIGG